MIKKAPKKTLKSKLKLNHKNWYFHIPFMKKYFENRFITHIFWTPKFTMPNTQRKTPNTSLFIKLSMWIFRWKQIFQFSTKKYIYNFLYCVSRRRHYRRNPVVGEFWRLNLWVQKRGIMDLFLKYFFMKLLWKDQFCMY
jgi:hypothetical protein